MQKRGFNFWCEHLSSHNVTIVEATNQQNCNMEPEHVEKCPREIVWTINIFCFNHMNCRDCLLLHLTYPVSTVVFQLAVTRNYKDTSSMSVRVKYVERQHYWNKIIKQIEKSNVLQRLLIGLLKSSINKNNKVFRH